MMAFSISLAQESDDTNLDNVAAAEVFLCRALKLIPNDVIKQANLEICKDENRLLGWLSANFR